MRTTGKKDGTQETETPARDGRDDELDLLIERSVIAATLETALAKLDAGDVAGARAIVLHVRRELEKPWEPAP